MPSSLSSTSSETQPYPAPALEKGLDILEYLADQSIPRSQAEIAAALDRSPNEIYRMLASLVFRRYVHKDEATNRYRLTLRLYELSRQQHLPTLLRRAAQLPMESLCESISQSCHLSVEHNASLLVLMEKMPARAVCLAVGEGKTFPLSQTASGKLLIARQSEDVAARLLQLEADQHGYSPSTLKKIRAAIEHAREEGCLEQNSEMTAGVIDIAVPVGHDGTDTAAVLAVSYLPAAQPKRETRRSYSEAVRACAAEINLNLGMTV